MERIKRKSGFKEILKNEAKKLRTTIDDEKLVITSIENLSTEIFYEIFDYLDGYDIYQAFSNLNIRFEKLITSSSLLLKLSVYDNGDISQLDMKDYCRHVIIPNRHRIISFRLLDLALIDEFFTFCIVDKTFERLESINFNSLSIGDLMMALFYLKALPRLFALNVYLENNYFVCDLSEVYRIILRLPVLKYNSLTSEQFRLNTIIPVAFNEQFNKIEYLVMKHKCTLTELISILTHTPRLYHLTCEELSESYDHSESDIYSMLPNLTSLRIRKCFVKFYEFKEFLKKICSQLKTFFIWHFFDENYIEPDQWKQLILETMPQLQRFDLNCYIATDDDDDDDIGISIDITSFARQCSSQFWIERGWFFEIEIQPEGIVYSINSKKEKWFTFDENMDIDTYSHQNIYHDYTQNTTDSIKCNLPINLTIREFIIIDLDRGFIDTFSPILQAIQFTSLFVSRSSQLGSSDFIELINLLPNLDSLKVSYLLLEEFSDLPAKDIESVHLASINNKITRVWQRMNFALTNFLIDLCPRMEYLEIDNVKEKHLTKLVRIILVKHSIHIPNLYSICFNVDNADDEMIDDLKNVIDSEKLLLNYNIKRKGNNILLQWKLK